MTKTKPTKRTPLSVVASLRALVPNRPLGFAEARRIAELQANRLLRAVDIGSAPVAEEAISELPRVSVTWAPNLIGSGMTSFSRGQWHIRLNSAEPFTRQRFTLAHEFKHVLDAACEDVIYGHLVDGPGKQRQVEGVCDHFAACLLMPKAWVKKHWGNGTQELAALAWQFEVSEQAMLIRLQNLGLVDPVPRHADWRRLGSAAMTGSRRPTPPLIQHRPASARRYERTNQAVYASVLTSGGSP